jgi:precorrin-6A/cobalt-precorrin-6A reductase
MNMNRKPHLLLLGGTTEAYTLAKALADIGGVRLTTSLAGRTQNPRRPAGDLRLGGFGGLQGLRTYLATEAVTAVIDATHPFARTMGHRAAQACTAEGIALLRLERPAWSPGAGDQWQMVETWQQALTLVQGLGLQRLFLAIGRNELAAFAGHPTVSWLIRAVDDPGDDPAFASGFPQATVVLGRGPFTTNDDLALLAAHHIQGVICKNSGGAAGISKLTAARALGLPVVMLQRPLRPLTQTAGDIAAAVSWCQRHLCALS